MKQRIAIVGAGIAGLSAARQLTSQDSVVKLFDKGRGPGGRTSTRRGETFTFDHGAQYFTVRDPVFKTAIDGLEGYGIVRRWNPRLKTFGNRLPGKNRRVERWIGVPKMSAVAKALAFGLDLKTQCRVSGVKNENGIWTLFRDQEELGNFDALVVTSPSEQAKELVGNFMPPSWPLDQVRMEPCWAVMAGFADPLNVDFEAAFVNEGPISWVCGNKARPGRRRPGGWVIHSTAEWAIEHLEESADSVADQLLRSFLDLINLDYIEPEVLSAHRWRYAKPEPALERGYLWDEELALGLAGDWCHGSRIEGAYLSGLKLAERMNHSTILNA